MLYQATAAPAHLGFCILHVKACFKHALKNTKQLFIAGKIERHLKSDMAFDENDRVFNALVCGNDCWIVCVGDQNEGKHRFH